MQSTLTASTAPVVIIKIYFYFKDKQLHLKLLYSLPSQLFTKKIKANLAHYEHKLTVKMMANGKNEKNRQFDFMQRRLGINRNAKYQNLSSTAFRGQSSQSQTFIASTFEMTPYQATGMRQNPR